MFRTIGKQFAANTLLVVLILVVAFHLMVLIGVVPFNIVWGGRLGSRSEMFLFETISIAINILMLVTILLKAGYLQTNLSKKTVQVILWIMFILFSLNTVGNVFSENEMEMLIFTPLTFILAIFTLRLAID